MKKLFALLICLCSCYHQPTKEVTTPNISDKPIVTKAPCKKEIVLKEEDYEIKLSPTMERIPVDDSEVKFFFEDEVTSTILILTKEETHLNINEFAESKLDDLKNLTVYLSEISEKRINNTNYIYFEGTKNKRKIYVWMTIKNSNGFVLSCGGDNTPKLNKSCNDIIKTFKIK